MAGSLVAAQATTRVSVGPAGTQGDADSFTPASVVSADGRYVVFESYATNLVSGDLNGQQDVFVHDRRAGSTSRVSVDSAGAEADGESWAPAISADGRFVAFQSRATNLVPGDTNTTQDVFVRDCLTGETARASVDSAGAEANGRSQFPSISADGRFVAFDSMATNLAPGDTNGAGDVFVRDLASGTTIRASTDSHGEEGNFASYASAISGDGSRIAFASTAENLVPGDTNGAADIFVRDLTTGRTRRVSVDSSGAQANGWSVWCSISADGRTVAFYTAATNLDPLDVNGVDDAFVHDLATGETTLASVASGGVPGNGYSSHPVLSADGRFVAFQTWSTNLVPGDTNERRDVYVHDRRSGTTERASVDSAGGQARAHCGGPSISAGGRHVVLPSLAPDLVAGDTNGCWDVFVRDRGGPPLPYAFCAGDGSPNSCPCWNIGSTGRGCANSANDAGALLFAWGENSAAADTLVLASFGTLPGTECVFFQSDSTTLPVAFGDGMRCLWGNLKRLYVGRASAGGLSTAPSQGRPSVTARSATLGDPIPVGATRVYQVVYRDPDPAFCPDPPGNVWNVTNALVVTWSP